MPVLRNIGISLPLYSYILENYVVRKKVSPGNRRNKGYAVTKHCNKRCRCGFADVLEHHIAHCHPCHQRKYHKLCAKCKCRDFCSLGTTARYHIRYRLCKHNACRSAVIELRRCWCQERRALCARCQLQLPLRVPAAVRLNPSYTVAADWISAPSGWGHWGSGSPPTSRCPGAEQTVRSWVGAVTFPESAKGKLNILNRACKGPPASHKA